MHLVMDINEEKDIVKMTEISENGTKIEKCAKLDVVLQKFTSAMKQKEDNTEKKYFPPGGCHFQKNLNSTTYVVQTSSYKEYYKVQDLNRDLAIVVKTTLDSKVILSARVYLLNGVIRERMSRFDKILEIKDKVSVKGIDDAVIYCIAKARESGMTILEEKLKYADIKTI